MTTCDGTTMSACTCGTCRTADLPVNPFEALRVAYGMLLGEDEFRTLMGNARGKQMLHSAWLHRSGVVWGYQVATEGTRDLTVSAGLGVDGLGRDVASDVTRTLNVQQWVEDTIAAGDWPDGCGADPVAAHLVARFTACPTSPVPTLADPCDVTRRHDDYSRVVETATVELRLGPYRFPARPYHRIRVLLGIDEVGDGDSCNDGSGDEAGLEALAARLLVAATEPSHRARQLLRMFRVLAADDVAEIRPAETAAPDPSYPPVVSMFPVGEPDADVVLAAVEIMVRESDGHLEVRAVVPNQALRTALLPTATIQELVCGLAPDLLEAPTAADLGAPQVVGDSLRWSDDGRVWTFDVTAPLIPGSVRRAVRMTSLSVRGWVDEDIDTVRYDPDRPGIVIEMADRPVNRLVRITVHGTGATPVFGIDPTLPLAGLAGGPPVRPDDGRDAVLTLDNPFLDRRADP